MNSKEKHDNARDPETPSDSSAPRLSHCSEAIPEGYRHHGYAALPLCREYVQQNEGEACVHCKWFEMDEPATVSVRRFPQVSKEDAVADIAGMCVRFPPRLLADSEGINGYSSEWPKVSGENRCGEYCEQRRCGEEICAERFCD